MLFPRYRVISTQTCQAQKYPEGVYSQDKVRQPGLYFKGSEGVFEYLSERFRFFFFSLVTTFFQMIEKSVKVVFSAV